MSRAPRIRSRLSSQRPYTASRSSSGAACFALYQRSQTATSRRRKSAEISTLLAAAFDPENPDASTFRVLLAPPCLVQSDLLSLDFARIARHEPGRAERWLQRRIILDQRARDAVAHGAGLAALAAAVHVHLDVEA